MSQSIKHAIHRKTNFTIISNNLINEPTLPLDSRMLLIWALSKPDTWQLNYRSLKTLHKISNDKLRRIVNELQSAQYLLIKKLPEGYTEWHWYDKPCSDIRNEEKPNSENPNSENPNSDNRSALVRTDLIVRTDPLKSIVRSEKNDELFESVWREYPSKVNKKKGKALFLAYIKKNKLDAHQFTDQLIQDIESRCKNQQFGFDKLHFTTYMNGERFNDDYQKGDNNNSIDYDFNKLDFGG